jgi:hypothetical protein
MRSVAISEDQCGAVKLEMQHVQELVLVKGSLGRLNVVSFGGYGVRTEAQRWQVILPFVSGSFYTGC